MGKFRNEIEDLIGRKINDINLFSTAFNHTSYVNEQSGKNIESNERLEFLGDAVLEVLVSEYLYKQYPKESEGDLTRMRAQLVCEESLAKLTKNLKLNRYLRLGKGELSSGGKDRDSTLADVFEAFLGAYYLEFGLEPSRKFLDKVLLSRHEDFLDNVNLDSKTHFQEVVQQRGQVLIEYKILEQVGPPHDQVFTSGVYIEGELVATGKGKSKKQAEMNAASLGLTRLTEDGYIKK